MKVENALNPSGDQMRGFTENDHAKPIYMLNLLKFKDKAAYEDGRQSDLTGWQAYDLYSAGVVKILQKMGGGITFNGQVERLMLGEVEDLWDKVAIAHYPSRKHMLDMITSSDYAEIVPHRQAGLAGQLNIELTAPDEA